MKNKLKVVSAEQGMYYGFYSLFCLCWQFIYYSTGESVDLWSKQLADHFQSPGIPSIFNFLYILFLFGSFGLGIYFAIKAIKSSHGAGRVIGYVLVTLCIIAVLLTLFLMSLAHGFTHGVGGASLML